MELALKFLTAYSFILTVVGAYVSDLYFPRYHLAPPPGVGGWMNDPNGFSYFNDEYHLFYQYNPNSSMVAGIAHWGHASSIDLFHWDHLPIAMYPDTTYDSHGVFSGSALIEDDTMYLFYTGNVMHPGQSPDHLNHQALATSTDGINFVKYDRNPIIPGNKLAPNTRDPKVWKHDDTYYMVLGNSADNDSRGRVLLYASEDKINWEQVAVLSETDGSFGFMWECPDFFQVHDKWVLLFSPQGVQPKGNKYRNLFQTGYIVGDFDYDTYEFEPITSFVELDRGHDFYATQTVEDPLGRRIVVGWFDMWDRNYPEGPSGFTGQMTIPRELYITDDNVLLQKPVQESYMLRSEILLFLVNKYRGAVTLDDKAGEILVEATGTEDLRVIIDSVDNSAKVVIRYDSRRGYVILERGGDDGRRVAKWRPNGNLKWRIFVDASSIELFCGEGELTFASRFFPRDDVRVRLASNSRVYSFMVYSLRRSVCNDSD